MDALWTASGTVGANPDIWDASDEWIRRHMHKAILRLASAGLFAIAVSTSGLTTGVAFAATVPAGTVRPAALQCGWHPGNNADATGEIDDYPLNIHEYNGPDYGCGEYTVIASFDSVEVRCGWYNYNEDMWWDFVYDYAYGIYAWVPDSEVMWNHSTGGDGC